MKRTILILGALALLLGGVGQAKAADTYLFQWEDLTDTLVGNTYQNGVLIQSVPFSGEQYLGSYGLFAGTTLADSLDVSVNIFSPDGTLSDTWQISGAAGDTSLNFPFRSDIEGGIPLQLLLGATSITETGGYQTVAELIATNGDRYTFQFRSDVEAVPEPATLTLLGFGIAGLAGYGWRRRKQPVASV